MKISASIYSGKDKGLEAIVRELDACHVNYFHIDCNDDICVFDDIDKIRTISKTPVDLHLITSEPEKYFEKIIKYKVENVTLQYEKLTKAPNIPENLKANLGLSIVSETSVKVFEEFRKNFSFILFMATTPGQSGGKFDKKNFKKINAFRNSFPGKKIHVDGGVNEELSFILRNMGVDTIVSGSYLFKSEFVGSAMLQLKSDNIEGHYTMKDFMLEADELPVLKSTEITFYDVLKSIDEYKLGFTSIISSNGTFEGIITNADVRKSLLRNYERINELDVADMINRDPAFVYENETVSDMLAYVKNLEFPVLFLPVLSEDKKIAGAIKFNNLIKGES